MSKGFTIIEVIIAVAIVSILASIGLVQFQNYVIKSQVNTVMQEVGSLRNPIEICLLQSQINSSNQTHGCFLPKINSNLLEGNSPDGQASLEGVGSPEIIFPLILNQQIIGHFGNKATTILNGKKLVWQRNSNGTWVCQTDIEAKYRPSMCITDLAAKTI